MPDGSPKGFQHLRSRTSTQDGGKFFHLPMAEAEVAEIYGRTTRLEDDSHLLVSGFSDEYISTSTEGYTPKMSFSDSPNDAHHV